MKGTYCDTIAGPTGTGIAASGPPLLVTSAKVFALTAGGRGPGPESAVVNPVCCVFCGVLCMVDWIFGACIFGFCLGVTTFFFPLYIGFIP